MKPASVVAPAGHRYTCKVIGSYATDQQPLRQGHAYLERNGDGSACHSFKHCLSGAFPPLGTLLGPFTLAMPDPAAFGPLLAVVFGPAPSKRRVVLRLGRRTCRIPSDG
jgi:hypothetical protein